MCCTRLAGNTGRKNYAKKLPSAHHRTSFWSYIFATKAYIDNWKKLVKQQYLLHMSLQYGELPPTNGWDQFGSLGHPANFNGFHILTSLLQRRRSLEANQTLPPDLILPGAVPVLPSILAALLHGTSAAGISKTLRRGTRNGMTALSQREPPIFGWAAVTLGLGPHSSYANNWRWQDGARHIKKWRHKPIGTHVQVTLVWVHAVINFSSDENSNSLAVGSCWSEKNILLRPNTGPSLHCILMTDSQWMLPIFFLFKRVVRCWHGYLSGARCKWLMHMVHLRPLPPHRLLLE